MLFVGMNCLMMLEERVLIFWGLGRVGRKGMGVVECEGDIGDLEKYVVNI